MTATTVLTDYKSELEALIASADISQQKSLVELLALTNQALGDTSSSSAGASAEDIGTAVNTALKASAQPVEPAPNASFRVVGNGAVLRRFLTRPNNTTAYAANSVWGGAFVLNTPYPAGTVVLPTDIEIMMSNAANTTVFAIHILNADLVSPIPDGGVWAPPRTEIETKSFSFSGITLPAMAPAPGGTYSHASIVGTRQSVVVGTGGIIVCYLINTTSNTPIAESSTTLKMGVVL